MKKQWDRKLETGQTITVTLNVNGDQYRLTPGRTMMVCVLVDEGAETILNLETIASTRELCRRLGRAMAQGIIGNAVKVPSVVDLLGLCKMADAAFGDGIMDTFLELLAYIANRGEKQEQTAEEEGEEK